MTHVNAYAEASQKTHAIDPTKGRKVQFGFNGRAACGAFVRYGKGAPEFAPNHPGSCKRCARQVQEAA